MYIDVISVENGTNQGGGYILLAIAILASFILFFKFLFAIIYHLKWLLTEKCCLQME